MPLGKPLLQTLQRMSCGALILDSKGDVIACNEAAEAIIRLEAPESAGDGLKLDGRTALKQLISRGDRRFRLDSESWIIVHRRDRRHLVMHSVPIGDGNDVGAHSVIILVDLDQPPLPSKSVLQNIFGLTAGEANVALEICRGATTSEIAKANQVTVATIRSQLGSIFMKTQTHRQAELVALVSRVSVLP